MYTSDIDDMLQSVFSEEYLEKFSESPSEVLPEESPESPSEVFTEGSSESSSEVFTEGSSESSSEVFTEGSSESSSEVLSEESSEISSEVSCSENHHGESRPSETHRSELQTEPFQEAQISFLKTALAFLLFSMFCALFGAVYEVFSHSVYSYYMIYAFAFPLAGGAFPYLLLGLRTKQTHAPGRTARNLWNSSIVTFTVGSILQGILEIYGTTNRLMVVYLVAGVILVLAGTGVYVYDCISTRKV